MSKSHISKFSEAMLFIHMNYHYSNVWNDDEITQWNKIVFELQESLRKTKPENYPAEIKRFLKRKMKPLASNVGVRYVRENQIKDGLEHIGEVLFADPKRKMTVTALNDNTLQVTDSEETKSENTTTVVYNQEDLVPIEPTLPK